MKELRQQLKQLKHSDVNPSEAWLKNNRAVLLSQIKNTVNTESPKMNFDNVWNTMSLFVPRTLVFNVVRPLAVLVVVSMVATTSWITSVDASYNSLPGDWLYPAKRAAEKTQLTVASLIGSKTTEVKLHSEFAKRRVTETKQIVAGNDPDKQQKVQNLMDDIKVEIASVSKKLDEANTDTSTDKKLTADTVKDIKQNTEQVKDSLQQVQLSLLTASSSSDNTHVVAAVDQAKNLATNTSVKAVEIMVVKTLEGDKTVSSDQIKKEIVDTLQSAAGSNTVSSEDKNITEATDLLKKGDLVQAVEKVKEVAKILDASSTTSTVATTTSSTTIKK